MAKKPHSEVRWVTKYTGEHSHTYYGGMLVYERGELPEMLHGTPTRVLVTDYPPQRGRARNVASEPITDRELDSLVAQKVMDYGDRVRMIAPDRPIINDAFAVAVAHYSTDANAALQVVDKMKADGWAVNIYSGWGSACWEVEFGHPTDRTKDVGMEAGSRCQAICLAALAAVGVEVPAPPPDTV